MIYFFLITMIVWLNSSFSMFFDTSTHTLTIPVTSCPPTIQAAAHLASSTSDATDPCYNGWCTLEKSANPEEEKIIINIKMLNTAYQKIQIKEEEFENSLSILNTWSLNFPQPYNDRLVHFANLLDDVIPLFYPKDFSETLDIEIGKRISTRINLIDKMMQDNVNTIDPIRKDLDKAKKEATRNIEQLENALKRNSKEIQKNLEEIKKLDNIVKENLDKVPHSKPSSSKKNTSPSISNNRSPSYNTILFTSPLVVLVAYLRAYPKNPDILKS